MLCWRKFTPKITWTLDKVDIKSSVEMKKVYKYYTRVWDALDNIYLCVDWSLKVEQIIMSVSSKLKWVIGPLGILQTAIFKIGSHRYVCHGVSRRVIHRSYVADMKRVEVKSVMVYWCIGVSTKLVHIFCRDVNNLISGYPLVKVYTCFFVFLLPHSINNKYFLERESRS